MSCTEVTIKLTQEQLAAIEKAFGKEIADRLANLNLLSADANSFIGVVVN